MLRAFILALLLISSIVPLLAQPNPASAGFLVGVGKAEITPPPGVPTGGHGPAGQVSRGYWTRLYSRAFYFRDRLNPAGQSGHSVLLVTCDFFAFPLGLHREVWKRVSVKAAAAGLEAQDMIFTATHTHQGPGNYLTSQVYNQFGSSYSGFNENLYRFLADRIAAAVVQAIDNAQPSRLVLHRGEVPGGPAPDEQFIMNRSPAVFMLNWDRDHTLDTLGFHPLHPEDLVKQCRAAPQPLEPSDGWDLPGCPRLRAVDRRLLVLEILRGGTRAGAIVFFAAHPTVLLHSTPLYSSDFVGLAVDSIEREWSRSPGAESVVGFFNGAEGDITARRNRRDVREVVERSDQFRRAIEKAVNNHEPEKMVDLTGDILVRSRIIDATTGSGRTCPIAPQPVKLAPKPEFGAAAIGGAESDRTSLYQLGWREGVTGRALQGQGPKQPALDDTILRVIKLTALVAPPSHFPRLLPVSYAQIGELALGALPVEMSTTQALRIRESFEGPSPGRCCFQILGLANEYASYAATASEYAAQDYMGASTVWGPNEGEFFQCQLHTLSSASSGSSFRIPGSVVDPGPRFNPGPFDPTFVGQRRELPDEGLTEILLDKDGSPARHLPTFEWDEPIHGRTEEYAAAANRKIVVRNAAGDTIFDDDDNDFIKVLTCAPNRKDCPTPNQRHWAVIWIKPLWDVPPGVYQFEVTLTRPPIVLKSPNFTVDLTSQTKPTRKESPPQ